MRCSYHCSSRFSHTHMGLISDSLPRLPVKYRFSLPVTPTTFKVIHIDFHINQRHLTNFRRNKPYFRVPLPQSVTESCYLFIFFSWASSILSSNSIPSVSIIISRHRRSRIIIISGSDWYLLFPLGTAYDHSDLLATASCWRNGRSTYLYKTRFGLQVFTKLVFLCSSFVGLF